MMMQLYVPCHLHLLLARGERKSVCKSLSVKSLNYTRFYIFQNPTPHLLLCLSSKAQRKAKRRGIKANKLFFHLHTLGFTWLDIFPLEKLSWRSVAPRRTPELKQDQAISLDLAARYTGQGQPQLPSLSHFSLPSHSTDRDAHLEQAQEADLDQGTSQHQQLTSTALPHTVVNGDF